jgi:Flp pilus assembly protein TadB
MTGSLIVVLALVFAALFMLALLMTGSTSGGDRGRDVADRIERYGPRHAPTPAGRDSSPARGAVGWVTSLLQSTNSEKGLAERLDLAGSERKPAEWVLLGIGGSALLAAALTLAAGNLLIGVLGGALIGWLGMHAALSIRIGRRRAAFGDQLPDVLQLIAGSLQSGFSLPQAVDAVVREGNQPAADELSRALAEARIGADLEDALNRVADRMNSTDLRWTVMAIRIQREVGGNLAEVLRTTVATMRERAFLRRQVSALSAEGRLSAYVLVALPVVMGAWFFYSDPSYMRPLYTTLIGLVMLVGSAALVVVGAFWMRKLIKIEV